MDRVIIHLWYDTQAREAAELYTSVIPDSRIVATNVLPGTPSGDCEVVQLELAGRELQAISAGPMFPFNPSISLQVICPDASEVDRIFAALGDGGEALMPLDAYPFNPRFGWTTDRYGLSWQVMVDPDATAVRVQPSFLFAGPARGRAVEAARRWTSLLSGSEVLSVDENAPEVAYTDFVLGGWLMSAMNDDQGADFTFNEAVSLAVRCDDQAEIDRLWEELSAVPEAEQCGWLKDEFGVSWQILPATFDQTMTTADRATLERVVAAFVPMKKLDAEAIERAAAGR